MKVVSNYLEELVANITPYVLPENEERKSKADIVEYIVGKITRKKFRRRPLSLETRERIKTKVASSIRNNNPVHFAIPFGGYKHFWNPSYPNPDWAELFNFRYLTDLVSPVLSIYKPGVIFEYMSEDMILTRMNNYPKNALDRYSEMFASLLNWYSKQVPNNLSFRFFRVGDRVDKDKLIHTVERLLPERKYTFEKLSKEEQDRELHRSYRSMLWKGESDLSRLSDKEKIDRVIESRLIELAYYDTEAQEEFIGDYLSGGERICVCFSFGTTHDNDAFQDLTLGSTYGSIVDFWIGTGVLRKRGDLLRPDIVSRNQYEEMKGTWIPVKVEKFIPCEGFDQINIAND